MQLNITVSDTECVVRLALHWAVFTRTLRALQLVVAAVVSVLAAPEIQRLGTQLGLW